MKTFASALLCLVVPALSALGAETRNVCVSCHLETGEKDLMSPVAALQEREDGHLVDVHARAGLSCRDCHGGDSQDEENAKESSRGFRGKPSAAQVPRFCGRCHSDIERMKRFNPRLPTDQEAAYKTSRHGKLLAAGRTDVATCVSCHGAHGIRPVKDPRAPVYPLKVPATCGKCHSQPALTKRKGSHGDPVEAYKDSPHGRMLYENGDPTAPQCATCHGNHGAMPPGVAAVHHVCGSCHAQQDEYFSRSSHAAAFQRKGKPGCVACHSNHRIAKPSDAMLTNAPGSACLSCHKTGDDCYKAVDVMGRGMAGVEEAMKESLDLLHEAERKGMGVQKAVFDLESVKDHLTRARIKIHQFQAPVVEEELEAARGIIARSQARGQDALRDWQMRRVGLGVSLVLIVLVILALLTKIKRLGL